MQRSARIGAALLAVSLASACAAKQARTNPVQQKSVVHEGPSQDFRAIARGLADPSKRAGAADTLRKAALEGRDISAAIPELIKSLEHPECRYASAWALGHAAKNSPSVVTRLSAALGNKELREGASLSLWVASTNGVDVSLALIPAGKALGDENTRALMADVFKDLSLRSQDISSALPNLRIALRHDDSRKAAAQAVWLASLNHDISDFLPELREALKHDDSRAPSIRAISKMAEKGKYVLGALPEIVACLDHDDSRYHAVRTIRLLALKGIDIGSAVPRLARALEDAHCQSLAASALWFAAESGTDISAATGALSECLKHDSCRDSAAKALSAASKNVRTVTEKGDVDLPENPF